MIKQLRFLFLSLSLLVMPMCADDATAVASGVFSSILSSSVECMNFLGHAVFNGIKNSPEIARGTATLAVSGVAIYGAYWTCINVPTFIKSVTNSLKNLINFPANTQETNENLKEHIENFNTKMVGIDQKFVKTSSAINVINQAIVALQKIVLEKIAIVIGKQKKQEQSITEIKSVVEAIKSAVEQVKSSINHLTQQEQIHYDAMILQHALQDKTLNDLCANQKELKDNQQVIINGQKDDRRMLKQTHDYVVELHSAQLPQIVQEIKDANEIFAEQLSDVHNKLERQQQNGAIVSNNEQIQQVGEPGHKLLSNGGIFTHIINPKLREIKEKHLTLEQKFEEHKEASQKERAQLHHYISEINSTIKSVLDKKDKKIDRQERQLAEERLKVANLTTFLRLICSMAQNQVQNSNDNVKPCLSLSYNSGNNQSNFEHRRLLVPEFRGSGLRGWH